MRLKFWSAPPIWSGETCFIIAGGPSVRGLDLSVLRGRRVITVNTSFKVTPWAEYLFAMDTRWLRFHREGLKNFAGHIVTVSTAFDCPGLLRMRKAAPPGLSRDRDSLCGRRTSIQSAINLAAHFDVSKIVAVGLDGGPSKDGRTHHHKPHQWPQKNGCWTEQYVDLKTCVTPLIKRNIEFINASPGSRIDFWPIQHLEEFLENEQREANNMDWVRPEGECRVFGRKEFDKEAPDKADRDARPRP